MAVQYTPELLARATAWLALPTNDKRQPAGLQELAELWAGFQGRPAGTCRQCQFSDYQRDVVAYVRESSRPQSLQPMVSSYQIVPEFAGQQFVHEDLAQPVTAENMTDETVEFLISKGYDKHFVKVGSKEAADADPATNGQGEDGKGETRDYAGELEKEQAAHKTTAGKLEKEQQAHTKAAEALRAEKDAHRATKTENTELQRQVKDLQKQLDKATKPVAERPVETPPAPTEGTVQ